LDVLHSQGLTRGEEKQVTHTNTRPEQHHTTIDKNNTTDNHTKNQPAHLTTIEGGAATVRTTSQSNTQPDSLDARPFPCVVLAVAPAVIMDEGFSDKGERVIPVG